MLRKILAPDLYLDNVYQITPALVKELNVNLILFDLDNTLEQHYSQAFSSKTINYLTSLKENGISFVIFSNSGEIRLKKFIGSMNLRYVHSAGKPLKYNFLKIVKEMGVDPKDVCMVGDQLFTDVLGANIAGIKSILVKPIGKDKWLHVKFKRIIEKLYFKLSKIDYKKEWSYDFCNSNIKD